ncbi:hypothetical protein AB0I84_09415 [Streptomyces spectabilis]|uniref:hypothetical protein n=1 Tax=Streptomyces spectabilis TaxID=68270 RepID=UPI0033C2C3CF
MTQRQHITADNFHQAEGLQRPSIGIGHYVSPAYQRWAEQVERDARPPADTFTLPTTAAELDALDYADRVRVFTTDRALYDRLTGHAA